MKIMFVIPHARGKNNYGSGQCACDDKSIPIHPIRRLLEARRRGRQGRRGRGRLDPSGCDGRDVRPQHNVRTPGREGGQGIFREIFRRPPDDRGPDQVRGCLRGRRVRRDHGALRGRRGHHGSDREDQGQGIEGRDIRQSGDPRGEDRPVPPAGGYRPGDDRPSRIRGAVLHLRLRSEDNVRVRVGEDAQSGTGDISGRRRQRRDSQDLCGGRRDGARGRFVPVQEGRHGADDIGMARPRTRRGVPRWE